ncbi:MAG: GTP cyclohydrolase [Bacteroidetes bacterium]|nr:GTP cyclohydrolase [Bacteroidota bacterium]
MNKEEIKVVEIHCRKDLKRFVAFPYTLYSKNPYWTPPIIKEEIDTLDQSKNPVFKNAKAHYFLALKGEKIVGRVAVMINWIEIEQLKKKKVRFGWFDVIDDINVTAALMEKVHAIGIENGMEFIEGPVGFSNMDKAGMLVEGFEESNTMITWYNAPYYYQHFKQLGYQDLAVWVEYEIQLSSFDQSPEKIRRFSDMMVERYQLKILDFKSKNQIVPYVEKMFVLLEETYGKLQTFVPIQKHQIQQYKKKYFRYIHPKFIKCIADQNNELIAFCITMPSFTKALKKANGKLFPFGFLYFLKALYFNSRASFYLIGVHPKYQNKGVTAVIFNEMQKTFNQQGYTIVETNPELEENSSIQNLWKNYNHRLHKKRLTVTQKLKKGAIS